MFAAPAVGKVQELKSSYEFTIMTPALPCCPSPPELGNPTLEDYEDRVDGIPVISPSTAF